MCKYVATDLLLFVYYSFDENVTFRESLISVFHHSCYKYALPSYCMSSLSSLQGVQYKGPSGIHVPKLFGHTYMYKLHCQFVLEKIPQFVFELC